MRLASVLWNAGRKALSIPRRFVITPLAKKAFQSCGADFYMGKGCDFQGIENISVGNHVSFGPRTLIWTTRARVSIGNWVMFGPGVSIVTGNHRTDVAGIPMMALSDEDKRPEDDEDVVIEDDCWLGMGCSILKGTTIGKGCVIAAGAVVTKSAEPYGIYAGIPARRVANRFQQTMG